MRREVIVLVVLLLTGSAALASPETDPVIPAGAEPLDDAGIRSLLGSGITFRYVGGEAPITGTSTWDLRTGTAYGTFSWDDKIRGTWNKTWFIRDNRSCLVSSGERVVCQIIYRKGDGFIEVNEDGSIHTVSMPATPALLAKPLSTDEVQAMVTRMLVWLETPDVEVGAVEHRDEYQIAVELIERDGSPAGQLAIDARTGLLRPGPP